MRRRESKQDEMQEESRFISRRWRGGGSMAGGHGHLLALRHCSGEALRKTGYHRVIGGIILWSTSVYEKQPTRSVPLRFHPPTQIVRGPRNSDAVRKDRYRKVHIRKSSKNHATRPITSTPTPASDVPCIRSRLLWLTASSGPNDTVGCGYVVLLPAVGTVPLRSAAGDVAESDAFEVEPFLVALSFRCKLAYITRQFTGKEYAFKV